MKLDTENVNEVYTSELESTTKFSIGDSELAMVFDILRNKLYSNPVLAITREICSNAKDAHVEFGKVDVPIKVHLPNSGEPWFSVQDFGPGLSPERMINVFCKYGKSTKKDNNNEIGGFNGFFESTGALYQ